MLIVRTFSQTVFRNHPWCHPLPATHTQLNLKNYLFLSSTDFIFIFHPQCHCIRSDQPSPPRDFCSSSWTNLPQSGSLPSKPRLCPGPAIFFVKCEPGRAHSSPAVLLSSAPPKCSTEALCYSAFTAAYSRLLSQPSPLTFFPFTSLSTPINSKPLVTRDDLQVLGHRCSSCLSEPLCRLRALLRNFFAWPIRFGLLRSVQTLPSLQSWSQWASLCSHGLLIRIILWPPSCVFVGLYEWLTAKAISPVTTPCVWNCPPKYTLEDVGLPSVFMTIESMSQFILVILRCWKWLGNCPFLNNSEDS